MKFRILFFSGTVRDVPVQAVPTSRRTRRRNHLRGSGLRRSKEVVDGVSARHSAKEGQVQRRFGHFAEGTGS